MRQLTIVIMYSLLSILVASAILSLIGVGYMWYSGTSELPYLAWLLGITVADGIALLYTFAKRGLNYMPQVTISKTEADTVDLMQKLISQATSVVVVSNRASWLARSDTLRSSLSDRAQAGVSVTIITRELVPASARNELTKHGVRFTCTDDAQAPEARFTLINGDRAGAEVLAIARGVHPKHEITIFDNDSGPQMIAMARDIVRKLRESAGDNKMERGSTAEKLAD